MPPRTLSVWRNTHIYSSNDRSTVLGGLRAGYSTTNASLYFMLEIFCTFSDTYVLQDDREQPVERDRAQLEPGNYYFVTNGPITVTDEAPLNFTRSTGVGTRSDASRQAVRDRDQGCIITGRRATLAPSGHWFVAEAAHIFPLAYEAYWIDNDFNGCITIPPARPSHGFINSVQNGILLSGEIHSFFDSYLFAINPDGNHKIACFTSATDIYHIDGYRLNQTFLDNPLRPVDALLRWHFRQAVLFNMKGA
ncbi:hypothetical protein HOY82DRAFT_482623 [Tuber indicum]|nr:hypothetical protein HOY82DRAFT_482623 [Tuber indicum]